MTEKIAASKVDLAITPANVGGRTKLPRTVAPLKNTVSLREALDDMPDLARTVDVPGLDRAALEIGQLVRRARAGTGMTQIDLAKAAGLTQGALSDIERGKGKDGPSYRILRALWRALNPRSSEGFAENLLAMPRLLDIATPAESAGEVSAFSASADGLIKMLLDREEVSQVCAKLLSAMDSNSLHASNRYDCTMWRIPPHAHTRIATHDLTVFLGVSGALRIDPRHAVDSFDKGYIVLGNETIEVVNPAAKRLSFLSAPASWFLSALK
jgi:transcriptional regulator with XRE-family HTH domain